MKITTNLNDFYSKTLLKVHSAGSGGVNDNCSININLCSEKRLLQSVKRNSYTNLIGYNEKMFLPYYRIFLADKRS